MPAFHEIQFPTDIAYGSAGGPEFSTDVIELGSGHERRNQNWTYPRERWDVAYGINTQAKLRALIIFFYARRGRAHGFRFKNHDDYSATDQEIGVGDGSTTIFQLVKVYEPGTYEFSRRILKPVTGTVTVYIDDVEQTEDWSVDTTTGLVTFVFAPSSGEVITANFDFDVPARFDVDYLPQRLDAYAARSAQVSILELKS